MTLELQDDEALVLYDLLADYAERDDGHELKVRSLAERNALWALSAALDRQLTVPFEADYQERLAAARVRVEERGASWR